MAQVIKKITPELIWSLGALFFCYEFLLQVSPSVMVPELMHAFSVNATQLGNLSAFYLYAYSLMQMPVGLLLDHFGVRKLLTMASLFCGLGALIFSAAETFTAACVGRFLIGLGSSCALISSMYLTAIWMPLHRFALYIGLVLTIGFLGAIAGQAPLALLVKAIGWRQTLHIFGFIGIVIALLIWVIVRDRPITKTVHKIPQPSFISGLYTVLSKPQIWYIAGYACLMYLPTPAFVALWGVPFLKISYHLTVTTAALITSIAYIGYAVGSPFFGWLSDHLRRRKLPMLIGTLGALFSLLCVIYLPRLPLGFMGGLLFSFGFFSSGFLIAFSLVHDISPLSFKATSLGFVNGLNTFGGALGQPLIGALLDLYWGGHMENGTRYFSKETFHIALAVLPLCIVLSCLFFPFIKETFCRSQSTV